MYMNRVAIHCQRSINGIRYWAFTPQEMALAMACPCFWHGACNINL
jgi:hypothetical protein